MFYTFVLFFVLVFLYFFIKEKKTRSWYKLLILVFISVFSPQTIRDWNALPDFLISSAEGVENGVAKFTSLVKARH